MKYLVTLLALTLLIGLASADGLDKARMQLDSLIESSQESFSGREISVDQTSNNLGSMTAVGFGTESKKTLDELKARISKDFSIIIDGYQPELSDGMDLGSSYGGEISGVSSVSGIPSVGSPYYHPELIEMLI